MEFAKSAFNALARGDQSAADSIDWENLQVAGDNVGAQYKAFSDEANRAGFRSGFITSFSTSFHGSGGKEDSLTLWEPQQESAVQSIISAESAQKTHLLITVLKKDGVQKIAAIQPSQ